MILVLGLFVAVCSGLAWLFSRQGVAAGLAGVLAIVVLVLSLGGLLGGKFLGRVPQAEPMPARPAIVIEAGDPPVRVRVEAARVQPPAAKAPAPTAPLAPAPASSPPVAKPAQSGGLLRMLSGALLRALEDDDSTQPGGASASDGSRVEAAEADAPVSPSPAASAPRPAWIDTPPHREGSDYQVPIVVGPYTTREECDKKLPEELLRAVDAYALHLLGRRASGRVQLPPDYVQGSLIRDTWEERRVFALSPSLHRPMVQLHVLVGFDAKAVEKIRDEWKQVVVKERVYRLAAVGIVLLLSLTIAWAYLRLDLSTAGRYRWRLRLAAAAALLAVVFFGLRLS
jgi:hypothetical protein